MFFVKDYLIQSGFYTGLIDKNFIYKHGPGFIKRLDAKNVEFHTTICSKTHGPSLIYENGTLKKLSI